MTKDGLLTKDQWNLAWDETTAALDHLNQIVIELHDRQPDGRPVQPNSERHVRIPGVHNTEPDHRRYKIELYQQGTRRHLFGSPGTKRCRNM